MPVKIFIVSGEESGDLHGAGLIRALRKRVPSLTVMGMGGGRMRDEGMVGLDSREVSVVGLTEVLEKTPKILGALRSLKRVLRSEAFDASVFIDFPDFNLRVASFAKTLGIPVIYYVSPQVWAWRRGRIKKIARIVDRMLVIFPFEERLYRDAGVDVAYVGHPLKDAAKDLPSREEALSILGIEAGGPVVTLLPGSRTAEVRRVLPVMLEAGLMIKREFPAATFLLPAAGSIPEGLLNGLLKETPLGAVVLRGKLYPALRASDAAIACSGTVTLEAAIAGTPMVIVYRMSPVSFALGKALVKGITHIGLPNIIAGRTVVRELIQNEARATAIASEVLDILRDFRKKDDIIRGLKEVCERLGPPGAADRAAEGVLEVIEMKKRRGG